MNTTFCVQFESQHCQKMHGVTHKTPSDAFRSSFNLSFTSREDYEPFDLVLDYLVETQQVDSVEEALYVMMEMDQDAIYGIVQEKTIPTPLKKVAKKAVDQVKKKVSKSVKDTGSFLTKQKEFGTWYLTPCTPLQVFLRSSQGHGRFG